MGRRGAGPARREQHNIRWSVSGLTSSISSFKLFFSPDNGTTFEPIPLGDATPTMTQRVISIPEVDTFQAKIRIDAIPFNSPMRRSESINPFYIFTRTPTTGRPSR